MEREEREGSPLNVGHYKWYAQLAHHWVDDCRGIVLNYATDFNRLPQWHKGESDDNIVTHTYDGTKMIQ